MKKLRSSDTSEFSLTLFHTYNFFPKETGEEGLEPPSTVLETAAKAKFRLVLRGFSKIGDTFGDTSL